MAKISVMGAGSWGTALAILLNDNHHEVILWSTNTEKAASLNREREDKDRLPGVHIPEDIMITDDLELALQGRDLVVLAVASPYVRDTAHRISRLIPEGQIIVNVAKGIEESTLMTLSDVIQEEIPQANIAVLSGPSHAEEVARRMPTTCVVGAKDKKTAEYIRDLFMCPAFRVYTSPDVLGIELGGSLKNVIALAAGTADGLGCGDNTKAALITRGIAEIKRLGLAMGANPATLTGLSGVGDLIVTCASKHSRNRRAGYLIGQGYSMQKAMEEVKMVVEGVYSARAALALAEKYGVEMPIVEEVNRVLFEGKNAQRALNDLMVRVSKEETEESLWN